MYELSISIAPTYGILIGAAGSLAVVIVSAILSTIQFKQNV